MNKTIAREWLILVVMLAFGFFFAPWVISSGLDHTKYFKFLTNPYELYLVNNLLDKDAIYWILLLAPYVAVQLVRSLIWALLNAFKKS